MRAAEQRNTDRSALQNHCGNLEHLSAMKVGLELSPPQKKKRFWPRNSIIAQVVLKMYTCMGTHVHTCMCKSVTDIPTYIQTQSARTSQLVA